MSTGFRLLITLACLVPSALRAQCVVPDDLGAPTTAQRAARGRMLAFGHAFGDTRAALRRRFGAPQSITAEVSAYFNAAPVDSAFEWRYPSFSASVVRNGVGGGELVAHVELFDRLPQPPSAIEVGVADTGRVLATFGSLHRRSARGDTLELCAVFSAVEDPDEDVVFRFVRGRLVSILWSFYTG